MFFENTVSILKQVRIVVVFFLEEGDSDYRWDRGPEQDVLQTLLV